MSSSRVAPRSNVAWQGTEWRQSQDSGDLCSAVVLCPVRPNSSALLARSNNGISRGAGHKTTALRALHGALPNMQNVRRSDGGIQLHIIAGSVPGVRLTGEQVGHREPCAGRESQRVEI